MRHLKYLLAAAALGSLLVMTETASASPLAIGLAAATPNFDTSLVQKTHGWHCRKRYGWYHGHKYWHRHRRACYDYDDYDDYDDYGYAPYYAYPYFSFYFDDDHHHRHRHHHKYKKKMGY